jgi:hypothetical protein
MKSEPGPPMTLGSAAAAGVRLIVWRWNCRHQVEPDPAEHARRCGGSADQYGGQRDRATVACRDSGCATRHRA